MSWFKEFFGTDRPIIGLLHLRALPGDPFFDYGTSIQNIIDQAKRDLDALQRGGVDALLVTNEFSIPYQKKVSAVTTAAMGTVIGAILKDISIPFGAEAIYDGDATIELCAATGASFTRCLFTGAWAGDLGLVDRDISHTLRLKSSLRLDSLKMFYFVSSEDEVYLNDRPIQDIVKTMLANCRPDAFVVGGGGPGKSPDPRLLQSVSDMAGNTPVVCGTGCNDKNIRDLFTGSQGAFVGSSFKFDGKFENGIDVQRVRQFMSTVKSFR